MFEKISRLAEAAASRVTVSRRGFLGRFIRLAGGTALGAALLVTPTRAGAASGFNCKCCNTPFGCSPGDAACITECGNYCLSLKRCSPYKK